MAVPNRRGVLKNFAFLAAGAAGGMLVPRAFRFSAVVAQDNTTPRAEEQLRKLKIDLPVVARPTKYVPAVRVDNLLYVSGYDPTKPDGTPLAGKLGRDFDANQGYQAARQIALLVLSVVRAELGSLDKVVRLVKTFGMVNCMPDFTETPHVINGFNDLLTEVFGEKAGRGARSAIGMNSLPDGSAVEIETIFQVKA
jgi:enamine deaminase RidA (YjgF/YER057c/UK114 family)